MNKADLFRKIGWSQELIDHFTIVNDTAETGVDAFDDITETFETTTTTIRYSGANVNVSIP